jgi:hypothetical protein
MKEWDKLPFCKCCDKAFCCDEAFNEAPLLDPDLGDVCEDCYWRLRAVRNDLYTISQEQKETNE